RELLLHDLPRGHEPGVVVARPPQVLERAEGVEARVERNGEPVSGRVEPQRRGPGQYADAVLRPHRVPVRDAFHVVPHPVAVDEAGSGGGAHALHRAVDIGGHAGEHVRRGSAETRGPGRADEVMVPADAPGGHDRRRRVDLERADHVSGRGDAPGGTVRRQHAPARTGHAPAGEDEFLDAVSGEDGEPSLPLSLLDGGRERGDDPRPGAPGDVEARDRVPRTEGAVAAPLGPADHREEADTAGAEPRALLAGRELQIGLGPAPGPLVLGAVESGGAEPVLGRELERVGDAETALFRRIHEEQPAEGPPRLPTQVRPRFLVHDDDPTSGLEGFRGGDETGQPPTDHQDVCGRGCGRHEVSVDS
ncbi:unnamed protein product, partial [Penicillium discolor]